MKYKEYLLTLFLQSELTFIQQKGLNATLFWWWLLNSLCIPHLMERFPRNRNKKIWPWAENCNMTSLREHWLFKVLFTNYYNLDKIRKRQLTNHEKCFILEMTNCLIHVFLIQLCRGRGRSRSGSCGSCGSWIQFSVVKSDTNNWPESILTDWLCSWV